jgi:hypothetical protein
MEVGIFLIIILARSEDRSEYFTDAYITPMHLTDLEKAEEFAEIIAEERFAHIPGTVIEKVTIKEVSEAQV